MKHEIEIRPFRVPNFVFLVRPTGKFKNGWKEAPVIPLSELDGKTLDTMCIEFRRAVFEKAGIQDMMRQAD